MTVSVEVSTLPVQLRKVIGNRACMEKFGATLIKTLIQGYLTMKESKTAMRGLQPTTIYISEDATQAHFVDLLSMTSWYVKPKHQIRSSQPYSFADEFAGHKWTKSTPLLDMYSLGVIILEILAGTEVVLSCREREDVIELILECKEHIDEDTA